MALEPVDECSFEGDFEFDAPQWVDFGNEQLENDSNSENYDWWFDKVHPLHSPDMSTPETKPVPKKRPLRKSVLATEGFKLSIETAKTSSLSGKSALASKTSTSGKNSPPDKFTLPGKSSLSHPTKDLESNTSNRGNTGDANTTNTKEGDGIKKPRRCWQLNGHGSLSFSPQSLSNLPEDLQPKRCSSNSASNKNSLPLRGSTDLVASPLSAISPKKKLGVRNKNLKTARRSCPQKLQKSRKAWNENSTSRKNLNDEVDEELQKMIEQHNRKILSQQSEYDLNGRRIQKTSPPMKTAKKENKKPAPTKANQSLVIEDELKELIEKHNRRIWMAQNSEYDLNGRRVRKGNTTTVAAPTKINANSQTTLTRSKSLRKSGTSENNQKREKSSNLTSKNSEITSSKLNKTVAESTSSNSTNQSEGSNDIETEIQEIITLHNSRLAAKKAKK